MYISPIHVIHISKSDQITFQAIHNIKNYSPLKTMYFARTDLKTPLHCIPQTLSTPPYPSTLKTQNPKNPDKSPQTRFSRTNKWRESRLRATVVTAHAALSLSLSLSLSSGAELNRRCDPTRRRCGTDSVARTPGENSTRAHIYVPYSPYPSFRVRRGRFFSWSARRQMLCGVRGMQMNFQEERGVRI